MARERLKPEPPVDGEADRDQAKHKREAAEQTAKQPKHDAEMTRAGRETPMAKTN